MMPSSMARRNTVPCEYGSPLYVSHRSVWESRCTRPSGPWTDATARSSASVTEWSPPIPTGSTPAATIGVDVLLDPLQRLLDVARSRRRVTVVDGGERAEDLDLLDGVVGPDHPRGRPDRLRPEPRPRPERGPAVPRHPEDRAVDVLERLEVRQAGERARAGEARRGERVRRLVDASHGQLASIRAWLGDEGVTVQRRGGRDGVGATRRLRRRRAMIAGADGGRPAAGADRWRRAGVEALVDRASELRH